MRPADPDRGKGSKSSTENKSGGGVGQKAAIQQWQMDLLLHKKLFNLRKMHILLTNYFGHNFRGFREFEDP